MALCLGSIEQIRSSKERGFDPRPPQSLFCLAVRTLSFLESLVPFHGVQYEYTEYNTLQRMTTCAFFIALIRTHL